MWTMTLTEVKVTCSNYQKIEECKFYDADLGSFHVGSRSTGHRAESLKLLTYKKQMKEVTVF